MDILSQALSVVEQAETQSGRVTLTLDLDEPGQRAAFAAALAVLRINGVDLPELQVPAPEAPADGEHVEEHPKTTRPARPAARRKKAPAGPPEDQSMLADPIGEAERQESDAPVTADLSDERDAPVRRSYAEAVAELTPDETRRASIVKDTFPRVRELLRDGANVEAVAQIQYRRWVEEHLDVARN